MRIVQARIKLAKRGIQMTKGEMESAKRRALNIFDKWVDCTGFFTKNTAYYYEMQGIIEDAVHCGAQQALGVNEKLESEEN